MTDSPQWKNRITRYGEMPADQFLANPLNPNFHPPEQQAMTKGSLDTLGWVRPVTIGKSGYLLDGHDRIFHALAMGDKTPVPFIELDLDEDEEHLALAILDAIVREATIDRDNLAALLDVVNTDNEALQSLLSEMAMETGIIPPDFNPMDEWQGMPEFEQEAVKPFHSIKVHFKTERDLNAFAILVNQKLTDKTIFMYYPKQDNESLLDYRVQDES